jgi:hypothetical protein
MRCGVSAGGSTRSAAVCSWPSGSRYRYAAKARDGWRVMEFADTEVTFMCRSIKTLFNFEPPVTDEEIRAAALQFVRKLSGFSKPSKANEAAFFAAVGDIAAVSKTLLHSLETNAPPRDRDQMAFKLRARALQRFAP